MAKAIGSKDLERDIRKAMRDVAKSVRSRLLTPTSTWSDKPTFTIDEMEKGGDLIERVMTESPEYFWLDEGTSIRFATMTKDFAAKTKPGSFSASGGKGGLAYVSKKQVRPGIQARDWTKMAELEYGAVLQSAIDKVLSGSGSKLFVLSKRFSKYVIDE